ncbi:citrate synthase [Luteipulveratus mongoliensis]|uniref:citrate synthase (unknown stereospecificity) n=1 Tax=Luteipulveratus mongoliensis TaxID=571913 RepID=A0A0K1JKR3_9MICO|nr:citrate synthase [Luteipulveratus mongoliensis]AKU17183.1 hypothetical protein VV02_17175 [Luteipulveratus mongoliensis]
MTGSELISAAAAADLLGVRRQTLYAYVSRGVLARVPGTDSNGHRVSMFDRAAVQALVERHRRPRSGVFELHIDTAVTDLDPAGRLLYRGRDACDLATTHSFEDVAEILWQSGLSGPWPTTADGIAPRVAQVCPESTSPAGRVRVALALLAADEDDDGRGAPLPDQVCAAARTAILAAANSLTSGATPAPEQSVAEIVATALVPDPKPEDVTLINAALVLLADHELATSTVAARAAASTHAGPYVTLLTGAAAMGGQLHGRAAAQAVPLVEATLEVGAAAALDQCDGVPPGFGHTVYTDADPRADCLFDLLGQVRPDLTEPIDDLCLQVRRRHSLAPNVDLAMAALTIGLPLRLGGAEAIFVLARLAGMTAHALEELQHRLRFRPRAVYTGPAEQPSHGD